MTNESIVASLQKSALGITDFNDNIINKSRDSFLNARKTFEISGRNFASPQRINLRASADINKSNEVKDIETQ